MQDKKTHSEAARNDVNIEESHREDGDEEWFSDVDSEISLECLDEAD